MPLLLLSGLLYLIGISVILVLKPELMFSPDGNWKEFGLGRNKLKYTWMPFWLFAIMWAIISYIIVLVILSGFGYINKNTDISVPNETIQPENISQSIVPTKSNKTNKTNKTDKTEMKSGYYILDTNETMKKGVPKYIYLGPEAPNLIYNSSEIKSPIESQIESQIKR